MAPHSTGQQICNSPGKPEGGTEAQWQQETPCEGKEAAHLSGKRSEEEACDLGLSQSAAFPQSQ